MKFLVRRFGALALAGGTAFFAIVAPGNAQAEQFGALIISDIWAAPAAAGASTQLHMRVSNEGYDDVHLLHVTTPVAMDSKFMFASGPGVSMALDSVPIRADEIVSFNSALWIELLDLKEDLTEGDSFTATLFFASGGKATVAIIVRRLSAGRP